MKPTDKAEFEKKAARLYTLIQNDCTLTSESGKELMWLYTSAVYHWGLSDGIRSMMEERPPKRTPLFNEDPDDEGAVMFDLEKDGGLR